MIGIVMLNYNGWDLTIDCITSIRNTCKKDYKVYIVDNASPVAASEEFNNFLRDSVDCEIIYNTSNKGYSSGNNIGIKRAIDQNCTHVLITNNDVIFSDKSIDMLCDYLDNHPKYGIAGPKVLLPNGNIQEINMGCKMTMSGKYKYLLRKTPLSFISNSFVSKFHAENQDLKHPFEVYAVSGCCFMLSKKATEKMYPLDENTFLYEEENIIGVRMERNNLKTIYNTDSEIIHLGGASTDGMSEFSFGCFINSEQYYCKNYLGANKIVRFPLFLFRSMVYIKNYGIKNYFKYLKKGK